MPNWNVSDWCFWEFKLCQILEVRDGHVQQVSDGSFNCSGHSLEDRCVPLSLTAAAACSYVDHYSRRLHDEGHAGLNYPDIHRHLVAMWMDICSASDKERAGAYERVNTFTIKALSFTGGEVDGVQLIRPRAPKIRTEPTTK